MTRDKGERGMALVAALLVTALLSAMLAGLLSMVAADQRAAGLERDQTQAYAGAHAGVEKLTADLGQLFAANFNPTGAQIADLQDPDREPDLPGIQYLSPDNTSGYRITFRDTNGDSNPDVADPNGTPISVGPYQGLMGLVTPYDVEVTARTAGDAEVRMRRTMQTIAIPVFQFGLFSENALSFHAGDDFDFGGRVHTNSNLYLASTNASVLTLRDRVTAVGDVIRSHFANGRETAPSGYAGRVRMARAPDCPNTPSACRNLGMGEGSLNGNVGSSPNPNWTSISVGQYNSYIRNGLTGGRRLDLPLVSDDAEPIDIIRRPPPGGAEPSSLAMQRYFNMAALRILLSDTAAELTGLPGVVGTPISLDAGSLPGAAGGHPLATSTGSIAAGYRSAGSPTPTPLIGGYILINRQDVDGNWTDVTDEILSLGISGRNLSNGTINVAGTCPEKHTNAIIRLQRIKDVQASPPGPSPEHCNLSSDSQNYWPNTLYDAREGLRRDSESTSQNLVYLGGVMHYVEFDVTNFKRWIEGSIGATGPGSMDVTGYVVYFSDRRNNKDLSGQETGEYGWEDFVNPGSSSGTPNNSLDTGEDVNASELLDFYGNSPRITYTPIGAGPGTWGSTDINAGSTVWATNSSSRVNKVVARANRAVFFRRALKIVNGGLGSLPSVGLQGLTIASENPVYVEGNFNACGNARTSACSNINTAFGPTGDAHRSAAIIADAVTLLSRSWNDLNSFNYPHNPGGRQASTTWYRAAIIAGKGLTFPHPGNGEFANFGSDGGAHNFLRFLEDWDGSTIYYRGSMVSLYNSRQAVGTWKCCVNVYIPPGRGAFFDTEFLLPSLLPPRTPMFRDINTLTFRQVLRPTQ